MREKRVFLEDHAHPTLLRRDKCVAIGHDPAADLDQPGIWSFKASDQTQGGRFAAATRAQEGENLPFLQLQAEVVDGWQLLGMNNTWSSVQDGGGSSASQVSGDLGHRGSVDPSVVAIGA